jgi:hypothetical protein
MNVGGAIDGLFYAFMFAVGSAFILFVVCFMANIFWVDTLDVCVKMETDTAKVQCMEAHYD